MLEKRLKDLKHLDPAKVQVIISTTHKETFFVEIKQGEELIPILDKKKEPLHFKNLQDIYHVLRKFNIHTAKLMQQMPYDEMIGHSPEDARVIGMDLQF